MDGLVGFLGGGGFGQFLKREGRLPDYAVACVGGGSNAIGQRTVAA